MTRATTRTTGRASRSASAPTERYARATSHHGYNYELERANGGSDAGIGAASRTSPRPSARARAAAGARRRPASTSPAAATPATPRAAPTSRRSAGPPPASLVLIPIESLTDGDRAVSFAVTPPWRKHVYRRPGSRRDVTALLRRHPQRAVEPDRLAVQHRVVDDLGDEVGELVGVGRAGDGNGMPAPSASRCSCGSAASSGVSNSPGRDRDDADPAAREVAGGRQRQPDDAALRRRVGDLADLAVEGGDRGGVDADAALAALVAARSRSSPSPRAGGR